MNQIQVCLVSLFVSLLFVSCSNPENNYKRGMASLNAIGEGKASIRDWEVLAKSYAKADASYGVRLIRGLQDAVQTHKIRIKVITDKMNPDDARIIVKMMDAER